MSTHKLAIPQSPPTRIEKKGRRFVARVALVEVVSDPCTSEHEAVARAIAMRQEILQDPEVAIELLRAAPDTGV